MLLAKYPSKRTLIRRQNSGRQENLVDASSERLIYANERKH